MDGGGNLREMFNSALNFKSSYCMTCKLVAHSL